MARTPYSSNHTRTSVMKISALLNDSESGSEEPPRTNIRRIQQAASFTSRLPLRSRMHHLSQDMPARSAPGLTRPSAWSSSTRSSERIASSSRRPSRPKYSEEEEAFIWFHRVDLRQEWDTVVHAFNQQFQLSHLREKSGLECKLYRVLDAYGVPQIREWRKRGSRMVEEVIICYGIIEWTNIRYPWMGHPYWPSQNWQQPGEHEEYR